MAVNDLGMTALHIVCSLISDRCQWIIHILLENKADPNIQDVHGRTPLHFAASNGNQFALTYLLRNCNSKNGIVKINGRQNIDLDLVTVGGETAAFKALQNLKFECLSMLLQCGADATIESVLGESIFSMAEQYDHPQINQIISQYQLTLKNQQFSANSFDDMVVDDENVQGTEIPSSLNRNAGG